MKKKKILVLTILTTILAIVGGYYLYKDYTVNEPIKTAESTIKSTSDSDLIADNILTTSDSTEESEKELVSCPVNELEQYFNEEGFPLFNYYVSKDCSEIMINSYSTSDYYEDLTIPSEIKGIPVTAIKDKAFANVTLKSINLPNSIKYIGKEAFRESTIESINLPEDLEVIEDNAFQFSELKGELVFPDNLKYIGASAFEINGLESVVFNVNLEVIETNAFLYCNLTNVVFKGNANKLEKIGVGAFLSTEVENKIPIDNFKSLKIYDIDNPIFELPEGEEINSNNLEVYKGFDFELANKYNNLDNFRTLYNTDK